LLAILTRCCCDVDMPLAYPTPTYSLYPVLAEIQCAPVAEVPFGNDYRLPKLLEKTGAGLTIVCNPNAPTGTFIAPEEIGELAKKLQGVLAVDEAYVDFAADHCLRLLKKHENVVILRTMSKGYSLAALRFGYALGSKRIIDMMIKVKDSYNVNAITQVAATTAIQDQEYFRENVGKIVRERGRLTAGLRDIGFEVRDSQANFVLARIGRPTAREVYEKLIEKKIFVRYFDMAGLQDKLRISVGTKEQNDILLEALRGIVRQEK
jgi:histidinol-phosphate aminotransferase